MSKFQHIIPIIDTIYASEVAALKAAFDASNEVENDAYESEITELKAENAQLRAQLDPQTPPEPNPPPDPTGRVIEIPDGKFFTFKSNEKFTRGEKFFNPNTKGGTGPQGVNAMVRPANNDVSGAEFDGVEVTGAGGCGITFKDTSKCRLTNGDIHHNGQLGIGVARAIDFFARSNKSHHNNFGIDENPDTYIDKSDGKRKIRLGTDGKPRFFQLSNGKWRSREGFEAGGSKFTGCKNLILELNEWFENFGKGCWLDMYEPQTARLVNEHYHHNHRAGNQSFGGIGLNIEIQLAGTVVQGSRAHNNDGAGLAIQESRNVTVKDFTLDGDPLRLRNLAGRRARSSLRDLLLEIRFLNGAKVEPNNWPEATPENMTELFKKLNIVIRRLAA